MKLLFHNIKPLIISVGGSLLIDIHVLLSDVSLLFALAYTAAKFYNDFFKHKDGDKKN